MKLETRNSKLETYHVRRWLETGSAVSVLHVFDEVCNLVNGTGEVVSLVTAVIGPGPFSLLVSGVRSWRQWVDEETAVLRQGSLLRLGDLSIETAGATVWNPKPVWEKVRPLHSRLLAVSQFSTDSAWMGEQAAVQTRLQTASAQVLQGVKEKNLLLCCQGARQLTGVGEGLTPAGDDFLLGVLLGLWANWPDEAARAWGQTVAETAVPHTTTLSAAWLRAAAQGETSQVWHDLVTACQENQTRDKQLTAVLHRLLTTGHTSGRAAWAGFCQVGGDV